MAPPPKKPPAAGAKPASSGGKRGAGGKASAEGGDAGSKSVGGGKDGVEGVSRSSPEGGGGHESGSHERGHGHGHGANDWNPPTREVVKPPDQLRLPEAELTQEITKMLTANNPCAPSNVARYNFKEKAYKFEPMVNQLEIHFSLDGWLMHKSSDEAKRQMELDKQEEDARLRFEAELARKAEAGGDEDDSKQLRNQFNFSERGAQTQNQPNKDRSTSTAPPPTSTFSGFATQWEIFDAYMEDQDRQRKLKERQQKPSSGAATSTTTTTTPPNNNSKSNSSEFGSSKRTDTKESSIVHGPSMARAAKVMERMVNQNSFDDIAQDFRYWEDASDAYREGGEGTLLPLWKFANERARRKHVTALCWNPEYPDLFAVGYGSLDFSRQSSSSGSAGSSGSGLVCCYSLKNPSHPEYAFVAEAGAGVMCLDFHPQHSSLLAAGLYDGTVCVYDVRTKTSRPIFASTVRTGKHTDPVWQVAWQEEDLSKALNFYSVSSDGRVTLWTMNKSELQHQDVMELKLVPMGPAGGSGLDSGMGMGGPDTNSNVNLSNGNNNNNTVDLSAAEAAEEASLGALAGGLCFDFNRHSDHLFVVGTEEGLIHKCSKAYNSQYLDTYRGHHMAVYTVRWNPFHPRVFLSASADWTVRLWDHARPPPGRPPVAAFDLNAPVGDAAWAPYSATVFAAVTNDGKVHVFDLNENKHEPMCEQKVVRKAKLTKIVFNPKHPIMLVGDDRGCVTALKLSPNLRKPTKPESGRTLAETEVEKLNRVLDATAQSGELEF